MNSVRRVCPFMYTSTWAYEGPTRPKLLLLTMESSVSVRLVTCRLLGREERLAISVPPAST